MLLAMINRYKMDNEMESAVAEDGNVRITFYAEQLFRNLMEKFRAKNEAKGNRHFVIESEYRLLPDDLQSELLLFGDDGNMMISPFLQSLSCSVDDVVLMKEYWWIIQDGDDEHLDELSKFKALSAGINMWSKEYLFRGSDGETVTFRMRVDRQTSGSEFAGFGIEIVETSYSSVRGRFSVNVDEVKWHRNAYPFNDLGDGGYKGTFAFKDNLIDSVESLSIRFAVHFEED